MRLQCHLVLILMTHIAAFSSAGGIAHIAKLLDYQETKRDIWLVMDRGLAKGDDGDGTAGLVDLCGVFTTHLRD